MTTEKPQPHAIVLVDDDHFLLSMYAKKFSDEGYVVESCLSVADAVVCLEKGFAADAVVFDLIMPQEDGFDLLRALKEKKLAEHAVLIALSNQSAEEEQERTEELGADAYIVKATMVPSEVFNTVHELITHRKKA